MLTIENILSEAEVDAIAETLAEADAGFADGAKTAGWQAKDVKRNQQLDAKAAAAVTAKVEAALRANPVFAAFARPRDFVRLMVSRYRETMEYGMHVDDALMDGRRTDLSFTLFISAPDAYRGGELEIEAPGGNVSVKEAAGSAFVYPSTTLHRVAPVTSGERLVVVGWVRSHVRGAEQRDILFELDNVIAASRQEGASRATLDRLLKVQNNLLRLWAED
jgi:PKHD-type hydroxylase